jgi:Putative zinc-finger
MSIFSSHVVSRLSAYCDGEIGEEKAARIRRHLEQCGRCRAALEETRAGLELARLLSPAAARARTPETLGRIVRHNGAAPVPRRSRPLLWGAGLAAALAVAFVAVRQERDRLSRPASGPLALEQTALRLHRERLSGGLQLDMCGYPADDVARWVCAQAGLEARLTPGRERALRLECATVVAAHGVPVALLACRSGSRPVTIVTAKTTDLARLGDGRGRMGRVAGRFQLRTWARDDQTYVLVGSPQVQ